VIIAYLPATRGGFIWDDDAYVTENTLLTAPDGWQKIWFSTEAPSQYFPLVYSMLRLERPLWGLNPTGYHWVNIILHGVNALLLWRVLRRLALPGAWFAAALFALHPVNVESVAWITERKNVLSLLFCLLAMHSWLSFLESRGTRSGRWYGLALLFQALALFSKTTACTLPLALVLVLWLRRMPVDWRRLAQIVPFLMLGAGMGLVTMWWERHNMQALEKVHALTLAERVLVSGHAIWFYLGKLLWPANLTFSYSRWKLEPSNPLAYGWLAALIGLGFFIWRGRKKLGRGPETAALFYVGTLAPLLGFVMLVTFRWSFVADHYQYVAAIGIFALAAAGAVTGLERLRNPPPALMPALCGIMLLTLGVLTWRQCGMYVNLETLWRVTLERNPTSWMAHINLGNIQLERGDTAAAFDHYQKADALDPNNPNVYYNVGEVQRATGQLQQAVVSYEKALQFQPGYFDALKSLAAVLLQLGRRDEAIAHYRELLGMRPAYKEGHHNLGVALLQKGELDAAMTEFRAALKIDPALAASRKALGEALLKQGHAAESAAEYEKVFKAEPGDADAHDGYGIAMAALGGTTEAVAHYREALRLAPNSAAACMDMAQLAWTLSTSPAAAARNGQQAVEIAREADQHCGAQNPAVVQVLAAAYAEAGRFSEAVESAQRALQFARAQNNSALASDIESQLELYRAGKPFRAAR
jgi:tetratricopeptide (TPR) repeat protein